jgi:hypothetical protein
LGGWTAVRWTTRSRAVTFGGCCSALGGVVGGDVTVQDMVKAVGERRWCNGPRRCGGLQRLGTTWRCDGQ